MQISKSGVKVRASNSDGIYPGLRLALRYVKPFKNRFLFALALLTIASFTSLTTPWFAGNLTESLLTSNLNNEAPLLIVWFTVLIIQTICMFLGKIGAGNICQDISAQIHNDLYNKLLYVDHKYISTESKGNIVSLFTHESGLVSNYFSSQMTILLPHFLTVIGAIILILNINVTMGVYICIFLPFSFLLVKYLGRPIKPITRSLLGAHGRLVSRVEQDIQLNTEIRTHNLQEKYRKLFQDINYEQKNTAKEFIRASALLSPSIQVLGYFTLALYLLVLGSGITDSNFSINELVKLLLYCLLFLRPISSISSTIGSTQNVFSALSRINAFLIESTSDSDAEKRTVHACDFRKNIHFDSVSFRYGNELPYVLKSCTFTIKTGEVVVLTGENGSGKSTLTALLLQLMSPTSGTVSVGDINLQSLDLHFFRSNVSFVRQTEQVFDTTIRDNLLHNAAVASDNEMKEVLSALNMWDWIESLPNKLDQKVGEQGVMLSGGQAQKIALARTLLENRKVIILDEATSMLDVETEKKFVNLFRNFVPDSTVIIIAHRPLSNELADRHIQLDQGRILELPLSSTDTIIR